MAALETAGYVFIALGGYTLQHLALMSLSKINLRKGSKVAQFVPNQINVQLVFLLFANCNVH